MVSNRDFDVIIVGSGLAGLSAARQLILAGQRVVVLEASGRAGGRITFDRIANRPMEIGASFIGPEDKNVLELLVSNDIEPKRTVDGILTIKQDLQNQLRRRNYWSRFLLRKPLAKLKKLLHELDINEPWSHQDAGILDQLTFSEFVRKLTYTQEGHRFLKEYFDGEFGYDIACISALDALHQLKCMRWVPNHSQQSNLLRLPVGGLHRLFTQLGLEFDIKYQHPVHEVEQLKNRVVVSGAFFKFRGRYLILAVPIPSLRSINFNPSMPSSLRGLWNQVFSAQVFRITSVYDGQPQAITKKSIAPFHSLEHLLLENDQSMVTGEARGDHATKLSQMATHELENEWNKIVSSIFPFSNGPIASTSKFWNDDFWHSGIHLFRPLGSWTTHQDLLAHPIGRVYFAGSETSVSHYGSMEGAVRSGLRAAEEILSKSPAYHAFET